MNYNRYIFQKIILNLIIQIKKSRKIIYNDNLNALKFIEKKPLLNYYLNLSKLKNKYTNLTFFIVSNNYTELLQIK